MQLENLTIDRVLNDTKELLLIFFRYGHGVVVVVFKNPCLLEIHNEIQMKKLTPALNCQNKNSALQMFPLERMHISRGSRYKA